MPLLPRRFERLQAVLNRRMGDLTVVLEAVDKPHNLSAILRTCDAVGVLEAHVVSLPGRPRTFNKTAKGSQKWVPLHPHPSIESCLQGIKARGFRIFGTHLGVNARDYRDCDFTGPSWARYQGKPWAAAGYRLLVPMVDAHGALRSLRAWRMAGSGEDPKRVAPAGKAMAGLVMACPIARSVLKTGQSPANEPIDVVITEGEPDFLTHAARPEGAAAPAVVGVVASAWSSAVADRLPGDVRIVIRTHRDAAGDRYAAEIRSSLADRVRVLDFSRPSDPSMKLPDDNDDAQTGELHSYLDNIEPAGVPRTVSSTQANPSDTWSTVGALVERLRNAPAKLHTGIENIDEGWRGGAPAGLVWVIGGAPGAGKTTWVTNLGHEWALHGVPVA